MVHIVINIIFFYTFVDFEVLELGRWLRGYRPSLTTLKAHKVEGENQLQELILQLLHGTQACAQTHTLSKCKTFYFKVYFYLK